jgi:hypothetical protein
MSSDGGPAFRKHLAARIVHWADPKRAKRTEMLEETKWVTKHLMRVGLPVISCATCCVPVMDGDDYTTPCKRFDETRHVCGEEDEDTILSCGRWWCAPKMCTLCKTTPWCRRGDDECEICGNKICSDCDAQCESCNEHMCPSHLSPCMVTRVGSSRHGQTINVCAPCRVPLEYGE